MDTDLFTTPIGVAAFPNLTKPRIIPPRGAPRTEKPKYSCVLMLDFPKSILDAAADYADSIGILNGTNRIRWPVISNAEYCERIGEPTWFKWRVAATNVDMPVCMDAEGRLVDPLSIRHGDRATLTVEFFHYEAPTMLRDRFDFGVGCKLRAATRIGGPVRGEDV